MQLASTYTPQNRKGNKKKKKQPGIPSPAMPPMTNDDDDHKKKERTDQPFAVWHELHRQWPQILHRQMATKGPELQSEQRHVRILPLVACTMAKACPEHWLAIVYVLCLSVVLWTSNWRGEFSGDIGIE